MPDQSDGEIHHVELGEYPHCEAVKGPFEFRMGPRCPHCDSVLNQVVEVERPADDAILANKTAADLLDEVR